MAVGIVTQLIFKHCGAMHSISLSLLRSFIFNTNYSTKEIGLAKSNAQRDGKDLKLSPEMEEKMEMVKKEIQIYHQLGMKSVPTNTIQDKDWIHMLNMTSRSARKKYYKYLTLREQAGWKHKEAHRQKKESRWALSEMKRKANPNHIEYGLNKNCIFLEIRKSVINSFYFNNLIHAMKFGQNIVIDMDYEHLMNKKEFQSCVWQLWHTYTINKIDKEPFHLNFCNVRHNSECLNKLKQSLTTLRQDIPLVNVTQKSYLDIFPKDKLVYLTPHCYTDLNYNSEDIYVIGGLVDQSQQGNLSMVKAKKECLRMARFPIDRYVNWTTGRKSLTISCVMKIMLTLRNTGDWNKAFEHIPSRHMKNNQGKDF